MRRLLQPLATAETATEAAASTALTSARAPVFLRLDEWHVFATPVVENRNGNDRAPAFVLPDGRRIPLVDETGGPSPPFDLSEAYVNYLTEAWTRRRVNRRLSTSTLDFFYRVKRFIPREAQLRARRLVIRWQGAPAFPSWPVDSSISRLLRLYAACLLSQSDVRDLEFRWFWPAAFRAALVLTHDVESADGARGAIDIADVEEELGFRSSFNFGGWYEIDPGLIRELSDRGFEVGMHGLVHNRSLFSSRAEFERQLPALRSLAEPLGAVGFRSPATHRVFPWLAELPVEYDCSVPHSDPYEPQPGGSCSLWPFFIGDVVELPYTLPQDHTLLTLLGHRSPALWLQAASTIEQEFGLIQCLTHPDPGYLGDPRKRGVYVEFLRAMAERPQVWAALPREVASWWRRRDAGEVGHHGAVGRIEGGESLLDVTIVPPSWPAPTS